MLQEVHTSLTAERKPHVPKAEPSSADADVIRKWILSVCRASGITPSELAREARLAASTLNRFVHKREGTPQNLNGTSLTKLCEAAAKVLSDKGK